MKLEDFLRTEKGRKGKDLLRFLQLGSGLALWASGDRTWMEAEARPTFPSGPSRPVKWEREKATRPAVRGLEPAFGIQAPHNRERQRMDGDLAMEFAALSVTAERHTARVPAACRTRVEAERSRCSSKSRGLRAWLCVEGGCYALCLYGLRETMAS